MAAYSEVKQAPPPQYEVSQIQAQAQPGARYPKYPKYFQTVKGANIAFHALSVVGVLVLLFTFMVVDLRTLISLDSGDECSIFYSNPKLAEAVQPIAVAILLFALALVSAGLFGIWRESYLITTIYTILIIFGYVRTLIDTIVPGDDSPRSKVDQCLKSRAGGRTSLELIEDYFQLLYATLMLALLLVYYRMLWQMRQWKIAAEKDRFAGYSLAAINKV